MENSNKDFHEVSEFKTRIDVLLCDIDDTLTDEGELRAEAYSALWNLHDAGIKIIPVTGRPAGWCEMIARLWPVYAVVGENGAFYFRYDREAKKMKRNFAANEEERAQNQIKLRKLEKSIPAAVPGAGISSDQFSRLFDLAIDFCEDVPALPQDQVQKIKKLFEEAGATAKVSSIHVNGWFGQFDKKSQSINLLKTELRLTDEQIQKSCAFVGDSPNDEPMWSHFKHSFAVANIKNFLNQLKDKPAYVTTKTGGQGFVQLAERLIVLR